MPGEPDSRPVTEIARAVFGNSITIKTVSRLPFGAVNTTWLVNDLYIFRIGTGIGSSTTFAKEEWCIAQAKKKAIPVPEIVGTGQIGELPYMVQVRLQGQSGTEIRDGYAGMWQSLGDYSSRLATIRLDRFGKQFMNEQEPKLQAWNEWVSRQLEYLFPASGQLWKNLFDSRSLDRLQSMVQGIADVNSPAVLAHGDMSEYNVIVDAGGVCFLIDWGDAGGFPEYWDLAQVCAWHEPGHCSIIAFCEGYGISPDEFSSLQPWLRRVQVWRWLFSIRWSMNQLNWINKDFVQLSLKRLRMDLSTA